MQTTQNSALRTITGCLATTDSQHLHNETKILLMQSHLNMLGIQFYEAALDPSHPNHSITKYQPFYSRIPPNKVTSTNIRSHIPQTNMSHAFLFAL